MAKRTVICFVFDDLREIVEQLDERRKAKRPSLKRTLDRAMRLVNSGQKMGQRMEDKLVEYKSAREDAIKRLKELRGKRRKGR
jgi:hypothetical protein